MDSIIKKCSYGFCHPIWLDDGLVIQKKPKQASLERANSALAFSFGNYQMVISGESTQENSIAAGKGQCGDFESRDVGSDIGERCPVPRELVRGMNAADSCDFDDVIGKIMKQRDELSRSNNAAGEEITRLRLENENLRNLNAISKRITNSQQDEITKLRVEIVKKRMEHQEKIDELNEMINKLNSRSRSLCAQSALDGGIFWNSQCNMDSQANHKNDGTAGELMVSSVQSFS